MKRNRIYADTSVYGGIFDEEFADITAKFFEQLRNGHHLLLRSEIVDRELERAPSFVRQLVADLPESAIEIIRFTNEMADLRDAYIKARVVPKRFRDDAAHVAAASVIRADLITSWNFKHPVKWERIRAFNAVNIRLGYPFMTILSPREVISDE
jgi:hypothetical protein